MLFAGVLELKGITFVLTRGSKKGLQLSTVVDPILAADSIKLAHNALVVSDVGAAGQLRIVASSPEYISS